MAARGASWHALQSCWSWFARPGSRDVLTQETECSPQLAPLTAGHICIRGDFAPPPVVGDVDERPDECARGVASANGGTKSGPPNDYNSTFSEILSAALSSVSR